jgi:hypothetical protein
LASTISFSGLARMDYSLLGNNVLKDHSQPPGAQIPQMAEEILQGASGRIVVVSV